MPAHPQRAVLYIRSATGAATQLQHQESELREHCERMQYRVEAVHRDGPASGRRHDRPGLAAAMRDLEQETGTVLLAWGWAQLTRDAEHAAHLDRQVAELGARIEVVA